MRDRDSLILESLYHTILENNGMDAKYAELERRSKDGDESAKEHSQMIIDKIGLKKGYHTEIPLYHGSKSGGIKKFKGKLGIAANLSFNVEYAKRYAGENGKIYKVYTKGYIFDPRNEEHGKRYKEAMIKYVGLDYAKENDIWYLEDPKDVIENATFEYFEQPIIRNALKKAGFDGYLERQGIDESLGRDMGIFDSSNIKSADPFTYDDNGEIIPLSQRFDSSKDDIRF